MPDTPQAISALPQNLTDIAFFIGTTIAGIIATLAMKRGERDKKEIPASPSPESTGIALGLIEHGFQRDIAADTARTAEAVESIEDMVKGFLKEAEQEKQESRERFTERRLNTLETNQGSMIDKLDALLDRITQAEKASQKRHVERGRDRQAGS